MSCPFTTSRWLLSALLLSSVACSTTGSGVLYVEPSIKRADVRLHRIAIVPNRLPANLRDPERWRVFNFNVLKDLFNERGVDVVDYDTAVRTFETSGLPVEDTQTSRDKYGGLAESLGVDAIVVPYYGTFGSADGSFLVHHHFVSVATLQIYLAKQNEFFARVDINGESSFTTGFTSLFGLLAAPAVIGVGEIQSSLHASSDERLGGSLGTSLGFTFFGLILDVAIGSRSAETHWEKAFREGLETGLAPFLDAFTPGKLAPGAERPVSRPAVAPQPSSTSHDVQSGVSAAPQPGGCSPVSVAKGTEVRSRPSPTAPVLLTLEGRFKACADPADAGGFRHVKFSEGWEGFVKDSTASADK